ncbi:MAG: zinc-finger domain-containing protein [Gammaproteobacteria bacterium HGW-Gammaproteobacteria-8]|nr:MAG: zinc-finger domain-containing protein [Gammaproteobacteria bacterium HGW-Gammaproteobacteria-8]
MPGTDRDRNIVNPSLESSSLFPANTERKYIVHRADLPLSCPSPAMALWNSHPRVYLPIENTGHAKCPYCGAEYELQD